MSETKSEEATIVVKLFVDKERRRVLFAESDKDFVDVLFSFLTLPLGTFVRLLGKQSQVGCLDGLYKSAEDLSAEYFQTKSCKAMLLQPFNAAANQCCQLKINVDDTNSRAVFVCKDANCCANGDCSVTFVPGSVCKCGRVMEYIGEWPQNVSNTAAVVLDLLMVVFLSKDALSSSLLMTCKLHLHRRLSCCPSDKFGVRDPANLEQKVLQLNAEKITCLLKRSLTSKQPLTGYYFDAPSTNDDTYLYVLPENLYSDVDQKLNNVKIKVLQTKNNSSLLYAEVGDDFVDLLFGLLSIPLGSAIRTYGKWSSNECVDSIYRSIDGSAKGCMRPDRHMLLQSPIVAPFFGCGATNMLQVEAAAPKQKHINGCFKCFKIDGFSCHVRCCEKMTMWNRSTRTSDEYYKNCCSGQKSVILCEANPKLPYGGEGYVKVGVQKFMVTDDLRVLPLSLTSTLQVVGESKIQANDLVEKEFYLTKVQVMELIRAALVTRTALSSVLLPPRKKKMHHLVY